MRKVPSDHFNSETRPLLEGDDADRQHATGPSAARESLQSVKSQSDRDATPGRISRRGSAALRKAANITAAVKKMKRKTKVNPALLEELART